MPKASIELPDGTSVVIEGSPEEVAKILALYGGESSASGAGAPSQEKKAKQKHISRKEKGRTVEKKDTGDKVDLAEIINLIKNCDEAEAIEIMILDKVAQVNRILLPLYIVHEYLDNARMLTSGEVSQITTDLGIPVHVANVSGTLSGTASKYVIGDKIRKKGRAVGYKISRRGVQHLKGVLGEKRDGK